MVRGKRKKEKAAEESMSRDITVVINTTLTEAGLDSEMFSGRL